MRSSFVDHTGKGSAHLRAWRSFLQDCARRLEVGPGELTVLLCGDEEMTSLNQRFRGRQGPTDVLSFPGHDPDPEGKLHLGDIAVSVDRAGLQAAEAGWDLGQEVRRLLVHGLLHVLGYDHETDDGEMEALEKDLLRDLLPSLAGDRGRDVEGLRALEIVALVALSVLYVSLSAAQRSLQGLPLISLSRKVKAERARRLLDPDSADRIALALARLLTLLAAALLAFSLATAAGGERPFLPAFLFVAVALLLVGEGLVARPLAARFPEPVFALAHPLIRVSTLLLAPFSHFLAALSRSSLPSNGEGGEKDEEEMEEELQAYIDVGEAQGILEGEEGELVQQIVSFGDTIVREVMTPRTEMVAVSAEAGVEEARRLFLDSRHSRLPVFRVSLDEIVGVLSVRDLLGVSGEGAPPVSLEKIMRPLHLVPETLGVAELLRDLQRKRMPMAVVVDEYGGTAGLVTIEDLLEEIVGEIKDEHEVEEEIVSLGEEGWLVNGLCSVEDLEEAVEEEFERGEYDSVGGLIFSRLGRLPEVGETLRVGELEMEVLQLARRRVARVRVRRLKGAGEGESGS